MSSATVLPHGGDGRGPMIVAVGWLFTVVATITVGLWAHTRRRQRMPLGWDVWLMIGALILRIVTQALITVMLKYGLGKHDADLTPNDIIMTLKYTWIGVPPSFLCSLLARFSITVLLIRLFGKVHKWFKWFLLFMAGLLIVMTIAGIVISFAQVSPVEALWNIFLVPTRRWDGRVFLYAGYLINSVYTFSDLVYVLFPVMIIWTLKMPTRQRIGLILVMCLSLFTMSMSILKVIWIAAASHATQNTVDAQYNDSLNVLFTVLEQNFVIIMGCIPSLRNLFNFDSMRQSFKSSFLSSSYRKKSAGSSSSGSSSKQSSSTTHSSHSGETQRETEVKYSKFGSMATTKRESHSITTVTAYREGDSKDSLATDSGQIMRTDQWAVTYTEDSKPNSRQEEV